MKDYKKLKVWEKSHELEYCCLLAKDLNYLNIERYDEVNLKTNEVKAMLIGLIKSLR